MHFISFVLDAYFKANSIVYKWISIGYDVLLCSSCSGLVRDKYHRLSEISFFSEGVWCECGGCLVEGMYKLVLTRGWC